MFSYRRLLGAIHKNNIFSSKNGILLMYSITNEESFLNLENWMNEIKKNKNDMTIILVGTKCDLEEKRVVTYERGKEFSEKYNIPFFEISSESGECVELLFKTITEMCFNKMKKEKKWKIIWKRQKK